MKCEYCLTKNQTGDICEKCGAPIPKKDENLWKSEPFFYNGYIVYQLRDLSRDVIEFQFWLGMQLIERLEFSMTFLREFTRPEIDPMQDIWELFLVAHGEKEVLEWTEKNNKYPAQLEVRRIENPEREYLAHLDYDERLRAIKL